MVRAAPLHDSGRLAALRESGLLDTPAEEEFDRLTRLSCELLGAPVSLLTFVTDDRQYFKSTAGLPDSRAVPRELPLSHSICAHVVATAEPLIVNDAAQDRTIGSNPAVKKFDIGAYAGVPLRIGADHVLGDLCVIDHQPREWQPEEIRSLATLGAVAEEEISRRIARRGSSAAARDSACRDVDEALHPREAHFRTLLENTWNIVHTVDAQGIVRYISPAAERVLGRRPDEIVGRSAAEFVHPDDVEKASRTLSEALTEPGKAMFCELRLIHADGSVRHVETAGRVIVDEQGASCAVVHTQDISERKRFERALRETEERYRMVVRASRCAVWDWHIPSGRVLWDGNSRDLLRADELGTSIAWWYERLHAEDRRAVLADLHRVLEGAGDNWTYEHRFLRGDGAYATVLNCCSVMRDEQGKAIRVIGSMTDATERRRQQEAQRFLARASALLDDWRGERPTFLNLARLVVAELADFCLIHVVDGEESLRQLALAHVDPDRERLLYSDDYTTPTAALQQKQVAHVVGTGIPLLIPEVTRATDQAEQLAALGFQSVVIVPLVARGGVLGSITLAIEHSPRRYGPVDLLTAEDLARRAALALEHAQLYRDAQEAITARDEMLRIISHDLRNPLNSIQLTAGFLIDQAQDRRAGNLHHVERILRATEQMNHMVQDLLDVSTLEAGRFALQREEKSVHALIDEARAVLSPIAAEQDIELVFEIARDLPVMQVDTHRVQRVLANLIGNAIKFTPSGGVVTVRAEAGAGDVRFTVTDTGPGIPADQLRHVFDRFWQARPGDRRGAGLGLAIVKGIVEAHGGRVSVSSPSGRGASFSFALPSRAAVTEDS